MNENNNSLIPSVGAAVGQVRTLEIIGAEIRTFSASLAINIIEIGRRMCEAKELLPYGQFGDWIKANTGYSRSTANNFMRIYEKFGDRQGSLFGATLENDQAYGNLTYTKMLALLDVPDEEREQFVQDHDVENMSTRELQAAIAERDAAIKRAENAERLWREKDAQFTAADKARCEADWDLGEKEKENKALRKQIADLEKRPVEVVVDQEAIDKAVAEAVEKAQADHSAILEKFKANAEEKRKALEKKAADAEAKAAKAAEKLKKAEGNARVLTDADGLEAEVKAANEEAKKARAEADKLRQELAMSGEATVMFRLSFATWQKAYANMMEALGKADEDTAGRLKAAIKAQIEGWTNG